MLPSLNLFLSFGRKKSWMYSEERSINGQLHSRTGVKIVEGWDFSWRNGIAFAGPVHRVFKLDKDGDIDVYGNAARKARAQLRTQSPAYTREGRGLMKRLMLELLSLPLKLLAFIVTLITLPLYIMAYIITAIVLLFWQLFMLAAALSARLFFRTRS
jgi:hypothetical protein